MSDLRLIPKTSVDREIIVKWLNECRQPIKATNEKDTGHIVVDMLFESLKAVALIQTLKSKASFKAATTQTLTEATEPESDFVQGVDVHPSALPKIWPAFEQPPIEFKNIPTLPQGWRDLAGVPAAPTDEEDDE
jgi:hypothetical protein